MLAQSVQESLPAGLAQPALRALARAGINDLKSLARWNEADLRALHGIGRNAIATIRSALAAEGMNFVTDTDQP